MKVKLHYFRLHLFILYLSMTDEICLIYAVFKIKLIEFGGL